MDLTPNDIRNYEFSNQMRGYDKDEVDTFLNQVATALEEMKQENLKQSLEIDSLKTQIAGLREFEDTIKNAAIDARRNADMTVSNAKKEAELILTKARAEGDKIVGSRSKQISNLENKIAKLELVKKSYLNKLRSLINSHLDIIDEIASSDIKKEMSTKKSEDDIVVTDSSEVKRDQLETIATQPSQPEAITTEEANAANKIIPSETTTEEAPDAKAEGDDVDPELVAALESYTKKEAEESQKAESGETSPEEASAIDTPVPKPGEFVETTASAYDVPHGFITRKGDKKEKSAKATDKVEVDAGSESVEPNAINPDEPADHEKKSNSLKPDELADELDNIAAKFAEEMDKAEKS